MGVLGSDNGMTKAERLDMYYHEQISRDAAIAALSLYLVATVVMIALTIRTRTWFMLTVAATGLLEVAGFACRVSMLHDPQRMTFVQQQCFLIISPVLLAIVEYICLQRLLDLSPAGRSSPMARWVARIFTLTDILCLSLQGMGGGMLSGSNPKTMDQGRKLLLVGLLLQLGFFSAFTIITIYVQRSPKYELRGNPRLRPVFICLYTTITLMFVRNIFRVVEFVQGFYGYLATHERYFYGLDFAPLYCCFLVFCTLHYGFYLGPAALAETLVAKKVAVDVETAVISALTTANKKAPLSAAVVPIGIVESATDDAAQDSVGGAGLPLSGSSPGGAGIAAGTYSHA